MTRGRMMHEGPVEPTEEQVQRALRSDDLARGLVTQNAWKLARARAERAVRESPALFGEETP